MDFPAIKRLIVFLGSKRLTLVFLLVTLLLLTGYFGISLNDRELLPFKYKYQDPNEIRSRRERFNIHPATKSDGHFDDQTSSDTFSSDWLQKSMKSDDEFMKQQTEIQRQRKQTLQETCKRHNITSHIKKDNYFVDEKYKLVYCSVPKVASTNWKLVFQKLAGLVDDDDNVTQFEINRQLKKKLNKMKDTQQMQNSLTFMFARNPFSRILSVYRNKLEPNSTFERAFLWQKGLGSDILDKLRGIDRQRQTYDLTFSEFAHFISDRSNEKSRGWNNRHWHEYYKWCSPCDVTYDVIGKLETLHDDARYIFKLAQIGDEIEFQDPGGSSPTFSYKNDTLKRYFRDVPAEYINDLYNRYQIDFDLFGYDIPEDARAKLNDT